MNETEKEKIKKLASDISQWSKLNREMLRCIHRMVEEAVETPIPYNAKSFSRMHESASNHCPYLKRLQQIEAELKKLVETYGPPILATEQDLPTASR